MFNTNYCIIKKDLFGTVISKISFAKSIRCKRKGISVVMLNDDELNDFVKKEEKAGNKVTIMESKVTPIFQFLTKEQREEIMQEMREQDDLEEEIDASYSRIETEEFSEWQNKPRRKTVDTF